ncbi:hypothetical protein [Duganella sp. CF458]
MNFPARRSCSKCGFEG